MRERKEERDLRETERRGRRKGKKRVGRVHSKDASIKVNKGCEAGKVDVSKVCETSN